MPSLKVHCVISKQRTGNSFEDLHKWIDSVKGVNHRAKNHYYTSYLKNYVFDNFGGQVAVEEWLFHIALDSLHTFSKGDDAPNFIKVGFKGNFVYVEHCNLCDNALSRQFSKSALKSIYQYIGRYI